ncbi:calcium-activated chloride channel regulator 3A-1-like [Ptychodera flava]|uniref:calcium-activated chloride channel regulator 3A-1-like n=1 Tax=Ptychodera flava TaxID=63121 RepID=UPI00396A642E
MMYLRSQERNAIFFWKLYVTLCLLYFLTVVNCDRNEIQLSSDGYENVLVAIHERIPEDSIIIDRLQDIFISASHHLHKATLNRTYFKAVTILVPKTWTAKSDYEPATTERYSIANFVVDEMDPQYGDNPYTRQSRTCGEPGDFVHFTDRWVKDVEYSQQYWGDQGKVVVHEWAHLRWGVFDEYPDGDDDHFYYAENGQVEATRCSAEIIGESYDIDNGDRCNNDPQSREMPGPGCRFYPDMDSETTASLMYANYLNSVG